MGRRQAMQRLPWYATCPVQTKQNWPICAKNAGGWKRRSSAQSWELNLLRARFARYETALRGSQVTVYTQDRDLRYSSISHPMLGRTIDDILGRTDEDILPADSRAAIIALEDGSLGERRGQER